MRGLIASLAIVILVAAVSVGLASSHGAATPAYKAGDAVYVCGCGPGCDCGAVSFKEGKCACKKELVKATVTKVKDGKVYYMVGGKEMSAPATGKYICTCGPDCPCKFISQKPGDCSCGKPLKKVE